MSFIIFLVIILLTFMLSIISRFIILAGKTKLKIFEHLKSNEVYIWFFAILIAGLWGRKAFNIVLPMSSNYLSISSLATILLILVPFWIFAGYKPKKNLRGILIFCVVFPIGEEILFRGIIQSLMVYVLNGTLIYIPVPFLRGVSLQVFISALCFGVTHFQYHEFKVNTLSIKQVIFAFVFGLLAGNFVEITGTILYTIAIHTLANGGATVYSFMKGGPKAAITS